MGYTHYWTMPDEYLSENVKEDIETVLLKYQDIIQDNYGGKKEMILDDGLIRFNGVGDDAYETFQVEKGGGGFCKTNENPYDIAVCETLLILKHHYDDFKLESDGFCVGKSDLEIGVIGGNWNKAIENVKGGFGYDFKLVPKTERDGEFEYHSFDFENVAERTKEMSKDGVQKLKEMSNLYEELADVYYSMNQEDRHLLSGFHNREGDYNKGVGTSIVIGQTRIQDVLDDVEIKNAVPKIKNKEMER